MHTKKIMNNLIQKLLIFFVGAFVIVQYISTQMLNVVPEWVSILRIILLILVIVLSFVFSMDYDKKPKDKDAPKSLTKSLLLLYIVLIVLYGLFKLRGVV